MRLMRTPGELGIDITSQCNLRCSYCYFFSGAGDVHIDLPTKEWLTFFEELRRNGLMNVTLAGGEPFIREDLKELLEGLIKVRIRFSILSNGTLLTDEMCSWLASTGRVNFIQVSLDGSKPESHDSFRGKGSFEKALEGIKMLKKHKINTAVRVTIHKKNYDDLDHVAHLLLEEIGLPKFSTSSAGFIGLCRQGGEEIQLNVEERSQAMETLFRLNKKYNGRISASAGPLAEARMWKKWEEDRKGNISPSNGNKGLLLGCGEMFSKISVRADGVIVPCNQISHIELGRINRNDLGEIWREHSELKRLRERRSIPLSSFEFCRGCVYIDYCTGNCPSMAYTTLGTDEHPDPNVCLRRFLKEGGRLPQEDCG